VWRSRSLLRQTDEVIMALSQLGCSAACTAQWLTLFSLSEHELAYSTSTTVSLGNRVLSNGVSTLANCWSNSAAYATGPA
jgi:hypothetical protein